jgi:hypothetical protein
MQVENNIKPIIKYLKFLRMKGCSVFINETEVNAEPTTDVMAALHNTIPNSLYPTIPAAD